MAFGLISPDVHSILICGASGTGKSVAARAVRGIAPGKDLVELPANLSLEQLFGAVDIERTIREGTLASSESVLSRADGNVLIADNINLQSPEVLHSLMNSVQEGTMLSEMNGLSVSATCDTLLIGTMNPDEGELDGHILDRFDMCVYTEPCVFPEDRREIVRRVLEYERDPAGFSARFEVAESVLRDRIASADYQGVSVPDGFSGMISEICGAMNVEGHRGDVAVMNVLRASAAFEGHGTATQDDLKRAAFLCLRHRRRELPPECEEPQSGQEPEEQPDDPPESDDTQEETPEQQPKGGDRNEGSDGRSEGDRDGDGDSDDGGSPGDSSDKVFGIGEQFDVRDYIPPESRRSRNRRSGRQDSSVSEDGSGRTIGYAVPKGKARDVALIASIRAAAPYQIVREHNGLVIALRDEDLKEKVRVRRKSTTILFVVDGSGSMGAQNRMVAVKGAILSMLYDSYRRRDMVGLVVFRGKDADVVLPPTRSVFTAYRALADIPTGGRTPLNEGLRKGYQVLCRDAEAGMEPVMVVLTDGRGNVGGGSSSASDALKDAAEVVRESGIRTIVVDTETGLVRFGKAVELAALMGSAYILLEDLNADRLSSSVESALKLLDRRSAIVYGDIMGDRKKILVMLWQSHLPILERIRDRLDVDLEIFKPSRYYDTGMDMDEVVSMMRGCDATIVYMQNSQFCSDMEAAVLPIKDSMRIIAFGNDPGKWTLTSVDHGLAIRAFEYMQESGDENFVRMFDAIEKGLGWKDGEPLPLVKVPWQGVVDPVSGTVYDSTDRYIGSCGIDPSKPFVGIIASRPMFFMDGLRIERELCSDLISLGINPVLVFVSFSKKPDFGAISHVEAIREYFMKDGRPIVDAMVKLSTGFIGSSMTCDPQDPDSLELLKELNVPIYQPVVMARFSEEEWRESIGLTSDITWQVAFPEFEGIIEPVVIGSDIGHVRGEDKERVSIEDRRRMFAGRLSKMVRLRRKPNSEKKAVIFLNNYPCNGVEANVGNAAGLDTLESVAGIMKRMKEEGYAVDPPSDGKELISRILDSKALSEFRWTTAVEMKKHGGVIHEMDLPEYEAYFSTLSEKTRNDVISTWGVPPGEGMVLGGSILITGVSFGNVVVAVQPKRGCFGTRCDGQVCKILHDPACPPTHQYLATYHYYADVWGADVIMHTGTHGSMEWTPGKGIGMTGDCYPDICMRNVPHLYIYNSDNPSEGLVAKRRSYATLVDHMQHLMVGVNLYGPYAELDGLLSEYGTARNDPTHADELRRKIIDKAAEAKMDDLGLDEDASLEECVRLCHEALSVIRNSQMNKGMHIFGRMPEGEDLVDAVFSIVRYGEEHDSLRDSIADSIGYDLSELYRDQGRIDPDSGRSYGMLIEDIDELAREFTKGILGGSDAESVLKSMGLDASEPSAFAKFVDMIEDIRSRIDSSDEVGSLMNGYDGGYISPGPSGYITRGRYDIMPTGRNFYAMDPYSVPSKTAWTVGCRIADETVAKFVEEDGRIPESIGLFWTMGELIATGGETMSEIMYLMGAEPIWEPDGRVRTFRIIPVEELGRPRIDVSINVSCILRDNMMNAIDFIDEVVNAVASLDESSDDNYVRKHSLESIEQGMTEDEANARMFGAPPGTYTSGVNLAVFASAWKEDKDLADIFVKVKGHGYGGKRKGEPMPRQFATVLSRNDIVFDRSASDETDLLSCSCRFSNIGGMISASRYLSGKDVKSYYGDTRDPRSLTIGTLSEEIRRIMRTKTFNPEWIAAMKEHGYKGANDIAKRITRLFGWQATTHEVDPWLFDQAVETFLKDEEMKEFFQENNPYALEEMSRRLLEANSRGLWDTDEETLGILKDAYLEIESDLEDRAGEGEYQGGSVDIFDSKSVSGWNERMSDLSDMTSSIRERRKKG